MSPAPSNECLSSVTLPASLAVSLPLRAGRPCTAEDMEYWIQKNCCGVGIARGMHTPIAMGPLLLLSPQSLTQGSTLLFISSSMSCLLSYLTITCICFLPSANRTTTCSQTETACSETKWSTKISSMRRANGSFAQKKGAWHRTDMHVLAASQSTPRHKR